jgi:RNA polymerase sigma-70 factor (ECF subfamily)
MSSPAELDADSYAHLKARAERVFAQRGFGHASIQPTVLLHEAWLKVSGSGAHYESRAHFVGVAARAMRQILIDRARMRAAVKRGGEDQRRTTLTVLADDASGAVDVLDLDQALTALAEADPRAAHVAQLRAFGGLTVPEVAEAMGVSERTAARSWRAARAFLTTQLEP